MSSLRIIRRQMQRFIRSKTKTTETAFFSPGGFHGYASRPCSSVPSVASDGDVDLLNALRAQKQQEEQSSSQDISKPPEPFQLLNKLNSQEIVLHRTFGIENISISCVYHDQTYGEGYEEEDGYGPPDPTIPMKMVQMTVSVSIGDDKPVLQIIYCTFGEKSRIEQVLLKDHEVNLKEAPYEGPDVLKLSDAVKAGLMQYLAERGIDEHLGKFLLNFMPQKVQQEHSAWLRNIEGFVLKNKLC